MNHSPRKFTCGIQLYAGSCAVGRHAQHHAATGSAFRLCARRARTPPGPRTHVAAYARRGAAAMHTHRGEHTTTHGTRATCRVAPAQGRGGGVWREEKGDVGGNCMRVREVSGAGTRDRSAPSRQCGTRARRARRVRRVPLPSCSLRLRSTRAPRMPPKAHAPRAGVLCLRALHACRAHGLTQLRACHATLARQANDKARGTRAGVYRDACACACCSKRWRDAA